MIKYLSSSLVDFPGPANQTRCFVHTVNLIAKSILKPFDVRKTEDVQAFNEVAHALSDSARGHEQVASDDKQPEDEDEDEGEGEDDDDNELNTSLDPIRSMLLKVGFFLRVIDPNPKLTNIERSYGKSPSH